MLRLKFIIVLTKLVGPALISICRYVTLPNHEEQERAEVRRIGTHEHERERESREKWEGREERKSRTPQTLGHLAEVPEVMLPNEALCCSLHPLQDNDKY